MDGAASLLSRLCQLFPPLLSLLHTESHARSLLLSAGGNCAAAARSLSLLSSSFTSRSRCHLQHRSTAQISFSTIPPCSFHFRFMFFENHFAFLHCISLLASAWGPCCYRHGVIAHTIDDQLFPSGVTRLELSFTYECARVLSFLASLS